MYHHHHHLLNDEEGEEEGEGDRERSIPRELTTSCTCTNCPLVCVQVVPELNPEGFDDNSNSVKDERMQLEHATSSNNYDSTDEFISRPHENREGENPSMQDEQMEENPLRLLADVSTSAASNSSSIRRSDPSYNISQGGNCSEQNHRSHYTITCQRHVRERPITATATSTASTNTGSVLLQSLPPANQLRTTCSCPYFGHPTSSSQHEQQHAENLRVLREYFSKSSDSTTGRVGSGAKASSRTRLPDGQRGVSLDESSSEDDFN